MLKGTAIGFFAGVLFIAAIPAGLNSLPIEFLLLPATPFLKPGSSIFFRPDMPDDDGFTNLFIFTIIAWPLLGAIAGALTAYLISRYGKRNNQNV